MKEIYRGWAIRDHGEGYHPVTGRFYALRYGVRMGANTEEQLIRMIDLRVESWSRPWTSGSTL